MMTDTQLATASLDDIVFDGRNQGYGAYQLRALYQRHIMRALAIATAIFALLVVFPLVAQLLKEALPVAPPKVLDGGNKLIAPPLTPDPITPPPPAAAKPPVTPPKPPTLKNVVPMVVDDKVAPKESEVPNQDELRDKQSAVRTIEGDPNTGNPNLEDLLLEKGDAATNEVVDKHVYVSVEQMPELPGGGGQTAIVLAIQRAVKYPTLALHNGVEGKVYASFTVNEKGEIVDLRIVKGLGSGLDEETIRAIKSLPRFIPGKQNGREVSVSFTVPVTYRIQ